MQDLIETHKLNRYIKIKSENPYFHLNNTDISVKVDIEVEKFFISLLEGKVTDSLLVPKNNILVILEFYLENNKCTYSTVTNSLGDYFFNLSFYLPSNFKIKLYKKN